MKVRSLALACLASLLPLPLVLACAHAPSVSESQCAAGDWQTIGYRDGALGFHASRLLEHQDACVPHGVTPDRAAYQLGWQEGIVEFCTPRNAYEIGLRGDPVDSACPAPLRDAFVSAWDRGHRLCVARDRVAEIEQAIASKTLRLETIDEEMIVTASAQLDPLLLPAHRIQLAARVKQLYDEKVRLTAEIPALEKELAIRTSELEELNQKMAAIAM